MSTRKRSGGDFDREIDAHLELEAARLVEDGMSPEEAQMAARRRFGSVTAARERYYEAGQLLWLDNLRHDVLCAIRNMRRYPIAATVAVASLAAGIGATTVTLTVRNVIFHKPPPMYHQPELLSHVQVGRPDRPIRPLSGPVPAPLFAIWRDAFGPSMAGSTGSRADREVRTDDRVDAAPLHAVTPELFSVLGVQPILGQTLAGSKPRDAGPSPAVLSYRVWQRMFDGRADVVGRSFWIDDRPYAVTGVMPERFWFGDMDSPIFTALDVGTLRADEALWTIVRRPAGVTPAMLEAQLQSGLLEYAERLPVGRRQLRLKASGLTGTPIGHQVALVLPYLLGTCVLLTLLIACANVAILMIAQWTAREHETAIRASIGASRGRIVHSLITESVVVAACGGVLGICATFALRGWIVSRGGDITFFDLSIDAAVLLQTAFIALATGVIAGVGPALYETRRLHANPLRTMASSDKVRQRWRSALVVFEIAVTVALLVVTTAMIDGYQRARTAHFGFPTRPLMSVRVENPKGVDVARVLDAAGELAGVAAAEASTGVPYHRSTTRERVASDPTGSASIVADRSAITPGYFAALGVRIRAGRAFSDLDDAGSGSAIANEALVNQLFEGRDPIGQRIWIRQKSYDIVGVVANYKTNLFVSEPEPQVFFPIGRDNSLTHVNVLVRAAGDPATLVQPVRRAIRQAAPGTDATSAFPIDQILGIMGQEMLIGTAPLFPLVAIGMLLTTAGIYGVLAFSIARRARELAVRVAIGASGWDLVRLVAAHTLRLVVVGCSIGIALTFALAQVVRAGGGAGSVFDPPFYAFILPELAVLAIGLGATVLPSRRALKIDPVVLLRTT